MVSLRAAFFVGLILQLSLANKAPSVLPTATTDDVIVTLSWEVDILPDQPPHILNGTVEQLNAQFYRLNSFYPLFTHPSSLPSSQASAPVPTCVDRRQRGPKEFPNDPTSHLPINMYTGRSFILISGMLSSGMMKRTADEQNGGW
jgi:hypothetical protein